MRSITLVILVLGCFLLSNLFECSIPRRSSLRFQEVTEDYLSDNSVGNSKLKVGSVGNRNLQANAITADKLSTSSIYQRHFSPNSVTAGAAAIELVHVFFRSTNNVATGSTNIPDLQESILPYENAPSVNPSITSASSSPIQDNPTIPYKVQGKARGPGTILGWYPAQNGHLLRYQSSRALRAITCADVELFDLYPILNCACDTIFSGFGADCACYASWDHLVSVDWIRDLNCISSCTTPQDICGSYSQLTNPTLYGDPQCNTYYPADANNRDPEQPDECFSYTSVEDVNNPQEGTPVYSPSVERITIDDEGIVEISFYGRGISAISTPDPEIDIIVVVLLNEQYGA